MKKILFFLFSLIICIPLPAQNANECNQARKMLRQKKEAFMTRHAQLTDEEAAKFFPLYFELHKRQNELRKNAWKCMCNEHKQELNESDYDSMLHQWIESENLSHELDQLYMEKYKTFLTSKKIYKLLKADILFNRRLLKAHPNNQAQKKPVATKK